MSEEKKPFGYYILDSERKIKPKTNLDIILEKAKQEQEQEDKKPIFVVGGAGAGKGVVISKLLDELTEEERHKIAEEIMDTVRIRKEDREKQIDLEGMVTTISTLEVLEEKKETNPEPFYKKPLSKKIKNSKNQKEKSYHKNYER